MNLESLDFQWYVPLVDGNRARAQAGTDPAPLMVELRTPSFGELRQLPDRSTADAAARMAWDRQYFVTHVRGVQNLTLDGQPVTTGAELWRLGVEENRLSAELFLELFRALDVRAVLREGLITGLPSPSGSHA